jgi:hypothetical protein
MRHTLPHRTARVTREKRFNAKREAVTVHPTFADAVWRARACAPQLRHGDALAALQYRLAVRAAGCEGARLVRSQTVDTDRQGR